MCSFRSRNSMHVHKNFAEASFTGCEDLEIWLHKVSIASAI